MEEFLNGSQRTWVQIPVEFWLNDVGYNYYF